MDRIDSDLHIDGQIPTLHMVGNQTQLDAMHANSTGDIDVGVNMTYMRYFFATINEKKIASYLSIFLIVLATLRALLM
jgi:hypothetical protein